MTALPDVLAEHAENCILLWPVRQVATLLPHLGLTELARSDERLIAHLDGLRLAGAEGLAAVLDAAPKEAGAAWAATILAAEQDRLTELPPTACLPTAVWWMDSASALRAVTQWQGSHPAAALIAGALEAREDAAALSRMATEVAALAARFPLYSGRLSATRA